MKKNILGILSRIVLGFVLFSSLTAAPETALARPASDLDAPSAAAKIGGGDKPAAPNASAITVTEIPYLKNTVTLDGTCNPQTEYAGATAVTFPDGGSSTSSVYLLHDSSKLYVCMVGIQGLDPARFTSLYLDPQGDGSSYLFAQSTDYSLRIPIPDATGDSRTSFIGDGTMGGWTDNSASLKTKWDGRANTDNKNGIDTAEYSVNLADFSINPCGAIFGMALYHHWYAGSGDDYGWPSSQYQYYDRPGTWGLVSLGGGACQGKSGKIAYVFNGNTLAAVSYYNLLAAAGYTVTLIPLSGVTGTDFGVFDLTIIADDTGSLNDWGTSGLTATQVAAITTYPATGAPILKPIIGLGEGGYAFFGRLSLFIGWPRGWHGPQYKMGNGGGAPAVFAGVTDDPVLVYDPEPQNSVGIYLKPSVPATVTTIGLEEPLDDHASLIQDSCRLLWGGSGSPLKMTSDGKTVFVNSVGYMLTYATQNQCPPPPPAACVTVSKSSPTASPVNVGGTIVYNLTYTFTGGANCPTTAKLVDTVPSGTTYVYGSASGGGSEAGGVITWLVTSSDSPKTRTFSVTVNDQACVNTPQTISNTAAIMASGVSPVTSTPATTHTVNCATQPIGFPTTQPFYAESELTADPYPIVSGRTSTISLRLRNLTGTSQTAVVNFQSAPAAAPLGIGLQYTTFGTSSVTLPAHGEAVVSTPFTAPLTGNMCFQASAQVAPNPALLTQSCLDVTEDFSTIKTQNWSFPIQNHTGSSEDVTLVVDNTCPGWTAKITSPALSPLTLANNAEATVTVEVTAPAGGVLGSGCHIDVQAWVGSTLIGGVRKIDIAPVHLPMNVIPPWNETEITVQPDPLPLGTPGSLCIELVNPTPADKTVTVNFSVADFGAGIGFTPAAALTDLVVHPGVATYCTPWTPVDSGTIHRCILATLHQTGYNDQTSQRNIDMARAASGDPRTLVIPFTIANTSLLTRTVSFDVTVVGVDPVYQPVIQSVGGGSPPTSMTPGTFAALQLVFQTTTAPIGGQSGFTFGNTPRVEIAVLMDNVPVSGVTVRLDPLRLFLPVTVKN